MSIYLDTLAERVRELREQHGLSLSQLSARSGVAKATLFKVESGRTNPTLETLVSIAETFDVAVQSLIDVTPKNEVDVVRAGEGQDISDDASTGRIIRNQVIGAGTLEVHHQTFLSGRSFTSAPHGTGSREHVYVISGKISVGPVGAEESLDTGDYAVYPAHVTHRWRAIDGDATVLILHMFPRHSG